MFFAPTCLVVLRGGWAASALRRLHVVEEPVARVIPRLISAAYVVVVPHFSIALGVEQAERRVVPRDEGLDGLAQKGDDAARGGAHHVIVVAQQPRGVEQARGAQPPMRGVVDVEGAVPVLVAAAAAAAAAAAREAGARRETVEDAVHRGRSCVASIHAFPSAHEARDSVPQQNPMTVLVKHGTSERVIRDEHVNRKAVRRLEKRVPESHPFQVRSRGVPCV